MKPGQWMIQNAATGAVGKTLAMIAKAKGVHVVNIVRRREGVAELASSGSKMRCRPRNRAGRSGSRK